MSEPSNITRIPTPDLREFFNRRKREIGAELNCISLGTIQSFDSANQTVTVTINFKRVVKEANQLNDTYVSDSVIDYPVLVKCPIVFMNGGGAYLTFPIAQGDTCLVLFCDRNIDDWFATGQTLPPPSERLHDLSDGIALVGIRSLANVLANYNATGPELGFAGSKIKIDPDGTITISSTKDLLIDTVERMVAEVATKAALSAVTSMFLSSLDTILNGSTELSIGLPTDTIPPDSTSDNRRIWVVTSVAGNIVNLEERRLTLTKPPAPLTRAVTVK